MTRLRRRLTATGVAILALLLAVVVITLTTPHHAPPAAKAPPAPAATHLPHAPASHPAPAPRTGRASTSESSPRPHRPPPPPPRHMRLMVRTTATTIDVPVTPFSVRSHQLVDPPHNTAQQWNTASWIVQATNPARPGRGSAYLYGHACQFIDCAFNDLVHARVGNIAKIITRDATLTYRVDRIGFGQKSASSLPDWAANITIPNRIVLVTCAYQPDGSSPYNLIVIAHLIH